MERLNQLPKYQICRVCRNNLNQGCVEQCMPKDDLSWFEFKSGTNLEDLPPLSMMEYSKEMSNNVKKVILGVYISKIVDHLQGRRDERHYIYRAPSSRVSADLKKQSLSNDTKKRDPVYQNKP